MIKLNSNSKIQEIKKTENNEVKSSELSENKISEAAVTSTQKRPEVVDAKVYQVKSAFVKNSVFVTLSYINKDFQIRPIEIFINSKDLTRAPEYVVLTRLISAIFRRSSDPMFILEELQGIFDPNGGSFKGGKYYHSFYAEIADVIERFFYEVNILNKKNISPSNNNILPEENNEKINVISENPATNVEFKICPTCNSKSLKMENGCDVCMECGYSKCDK